MLVALTPNTQVQEQAEGKREKETMYVEMQYSFRIAIFIIKIL